jgi:hypothetical protein
MFGRLNPFAAKKPTAAKAFESVAPGAPVGRCRLTVSNPVFKAPMVSALETII